MLKGIPSAAKGKILAGRQKALITNHRTAASNLLDQNPKASVGFSESDAGIEFGLKFGKSVLDEIFMFRTGNIAQVIVQNSLRPAQPFVSDPRAAFSQGCEFF